MRAKGHLDRALRRARRGTFVEAGRWKLDGLACPVPGATPLVLMCRVLQVELVERVRSLADLVPEVRRRRLGHRSDALPAGRFLDNLLSCLSGPHPPGVENRRLPSTRSLLTLRVHA